MARALLMPEDGTTFNQSSPFLYCVVMVHGMAPPPSLRMRIER
ncbi:MAG: hypothetical protein U0Q16_06015 [Bryobacteraceae bacterium]